MSITLCHIVFNGIRTKTVSITAGVVSGDARNAVERLDKKNHARPVPIVDMDPRGPAFKTSRAGLAGVMVPLTKRSVVSMGLGGSLLIDSCIVRKA